MRFFKSESFGVMFRKGIDLATETAEYIDGPGKEDSQKLIHPASIVYINESSFLTVRVMTIASWLLLHKAVGAGEQTLAYVRSKKNRVDLSRLGTYTMDPDRMSVIPGGLRELIARSQALAGEVWRIDTAHFPEEYAQKST
ncbi:MAG TPA: DUF1465 family protein [Candidatus Paceibacterota bacterium]|nr:DUF1465 family protein [Candidatus Paceibacterota bacterium]